MEIVLKKDFGTLGYKDDVVVVKNGYGFNYLIPNGIADFATVANKKIASENRKQGLKKIEKLRSEALAVVEALERTPVEILVKLSKDGGFLQKITSKTIIDALNTKVAYKFFKDCVVFKTGISAVGIYEVSVKIYRDVVANVKIVVKTE